MLLYDCYYLSLSKHEQANEARKLTPSQRRTKKIKKLYEDAAKGINVTVYRINSLSNQRNRFKVRYSPQINFAQKLVAYNRKL